jgi:hypothetical protein
MPPESDMLAGQTGHETARRTCDHEACDATGEFSAPRSRKPEDGRFWFCLEHIRAYNAAWNYYAGLNDDDVEQMRREDVVGQRPTWTFGSDRGFRPFGHTVNDPLGVFEQHGRQPFDGADSARTPERATTAADRSALATLDLDATASAHRIKTRYKELVKRFHPDANDGDKAAEDRLKAITAAYSHLSAGGFV